MIGITVRVFYRFRLLSLTPHFVCFSVFCWSAALSLAQGLSLLTVCCLMERRRENNGLNLKIYWESLSHILISVALPYL